jgi:hypothetical protein
LVYDIIDRSTRQILEAYIHGDLPKQSS